MVYRASAACGRSLISLLLMGDGESCSHVHNDHSPHHTPKTSLINSRFSVSFPSAPCPPPTIPTNGNVFGDNLQHLSSVQFWCDNGFVLRGSSFSQCNDGKWDSPTPVCEGNFKVLYRSIDQSLFC